jgi:hypothetical protein
VATAYITSADLTAYGVTDAGGPALIPAAQRVVDAHVRWPLNGDGSRFPRLKNQGLGIDGDYSGQATLGADLTIGAGSLTLAGTFTDWPTGAVVFYAKCDDELMLCSNRTGAVVTVTTRGYGGTIAAAHLGGRNITWAVIPQGVKDAICEQVAWLLQEGLTYQRKGGQDSLVASAAGASKQRTRADSPTLAPMARLLLRPYMQRTGYIVPG